MFITKRSLSRRTVLRGMGTALALPILDAMVPALSLTAQSAANPPRRFGAVYIPLGAVQKSWVPAQLGKDFEFSPILKPLEPFRQQLAVLSQFSNPEGGHAIAVSEWLNGCILKRTMAVDVRAEQTIDQMIANHIGKDTVYPSLEVATEDFSEVVGACVPQFSCVYSSTIAWRSATEPLPMEINPRVVFERMFGRAGSKAQRLSSMKLDRSILDAMKGDVASLETGLGPRDRTRLGEYLDNVREVERRIQRAESQAQSTPEGAAIPIGIPDSFAEHVGLMFDMLAIAYQADITRVFTFMMARDASQRVYSNVGVSEPHHSCSHHGQDAVKMANLVKIQTHFTELFAKFLEKLRTTPDGDGSLLDHSMLLYGSGMGDSQEHGRTNIPAVLAGWGVAGNRHIAGSGTNPLLADVLVDVVNKFGIDAAKIGTSTGRVSV
jgi:hypothetical protein